MVTHVCGDARARARRGHAKRFRPAVANARAELEPKWSRGPSMLKRLYAPELPSTAGESAYSKCYIVYTNDQKNTIVIIL